MDHSTQSPESELSPARSLSPTSNLSQSLLRASLDSERSTSPIRTNGSNGRPSDYDNLTEVEKLRIDLDRMREEKEGLATNYRNLLSKLTNMRNTLGNKLKQDAEELDRREQMIQQLNAQTDDLNTTVDTLKEELIESNAEVERVVKELDTMRSQVLQDNAQETLMRERELRETQTELERCRLEREEWERTAMQEKLLAEEARTTTESLQRDLELEREARERGVRELETEQEKAQNLQSVLEDFQSAKDHELRQAVKDHESQFIQVTQSLAEYKHRALTAEMKLQETQTDVSQTQELEKQVKEKNLLIGKLRHEAVIINEHLVEALRRLRRSSSDNNVDRRLVTNVLLSFICTPRADPKRFEMLSLLATILSWTDAEREKAGLQRVGAGGQEPVSSSSSSSGLSFWGRGSGVKSPAEPGNTDETESFSRLWVEFLLTEAASGEGQPPLSPTRSNSSQPGSPSLRGLGRRLPSFTSSAMASSPNLLMASSSTQKDKEKEVSET